MGQKVHPHGIRVGVIKDWDSRWFAKKRDFGDTLVEDYNLRKTLKKQLAAAGVPKIEIERDASKVRVHIHCAKPGMVIGKGGSVIQNIVAESGAKVDIEDDGTVTIAAVKATDADKAKKMIEAIVKEPEPGEIYYGKVVRLMNFGAFVNLLPGKDGMVHISKMADHRIEKVEDAVKEGDMVWVKVMEIDDKGRVNLSMKDAKIGRAHV